MRRRVLAGSLHHADRGQRGLRGAADQLPQGPAESARISEAQSQAQGAVAADRRQAAHRERRDPDWIARPFPQASCCRRSWQEMQAISLMAWCSSGIHPYLTPINSPPKSATCRARRRACEGLPPSCCFESFKIADDMLDRPRVVLRPFHGRRRALLLGFRRAKQFERRRVAIPNCPAHFERMKSRASVQKVVAYEKSVQAEFANAA